MGNKNTLKNLVIMDTIANAETAFQKYVKDNNVVFMDAASPGVVRERDLTAIDPQIFEKKYPANVYANAGFAIDNTGGYAAKISSLRVSEEGDFKTVGNGSDDVGKITLAGDESELAVAERMSSSTWTFSRVQQAAMGGINLVQRFLAGHNKKYNKNIDEIVALGISDIAGSTGLLNYTGYETLNASDTAENLTGDELYSAIAGLITAQHSQVQDTEEYMADLVVMPTRVKNVAAAKLLNSAGSSQTVLSALKANFPEVSFTSSFRNDDESLAASVTLAISTSDEAVKIRIPQPLNVSEVDANGFKFYVESMYRIGGADILEDAAGYYLLGL